MPVGLSPKVKLTPVFPATAVEECLREELIHSVESRAELQGQPLPSTTAAIVAGPFPLDSLEVVEILCRIDELLGFELPDRVVRAGGYNAIDQAISQLLPCIKKEWLKRNGGTA
jgi:acyl carrier protein